MIVTKMCTSCLQEKELSEFNKRAKSKDGLSYYCSKCAREKMKEAWDGYYKKNKKNIKKYVQEWCEKNREKSLEYKKRYAEKMKEGKSIKDTTTDHSH